MQLYSKAARCALSFGAFLFLLYSCHLFAKSFLALKSEPEESEEAVGLPDPVTLTSGEGSKRFQLGGSPVVSRRGLALRDLNAIPEAEPLEEEEEESST